MGIFDGRDVPGWLIEENVYALDLAGQRLAEYAYIVGIRIGFGAGFLDDDSVNGYLAARD